MKKLIQQKRVKSRNNPEVTYEVREYQCLDEMGCLYFETSCTCPGFRYRGHCSHLAVLGSAPDSQAEERR